MFFFVLLFFFHFFFQFYQEIKLHFVANPCSKQRAKQALFGRYIVLFFLFSTAIFGRKMKVVDL